MNDKDSNSMNNPAKNKLVLSGLMDLIIALFFGLLIAFTLFFLICPIFNITTEYTTGLDNNYSIVVAKYFGGMSGLVAILFLIIALIFLIGLIFSFSYIKSCFTIAKMKLPNAKTKSKILTLHGITQILIGIISITLAVFILIKLKQFDSAKIIALLNTFIAIAFLTTGSIKVSSAKSIRNAIIPVQNPYQQNYPNYYYYNY